MEFYQIYLQGLAVIVIFMTLLWVVSVFKKNASIVDPFWGFAYVLLAWFYFNQVEEQSIRQYVVLALVTIWGLRLSIFLGIRNSGKGEDFRYQQFRKDFGAERYWWVSFFQVFLLQGILAWLVSAPLLGAQKGINSEFGIIDMVAIAIWIFGFIFEAGGDYQLSKFKAKAENKGKLLTTGLWKYTRHPNYFGDGFQWIAFALFSVANHCYLPILSAVLMNFLLLKVSGVKLLEKTLSKTKPGFEDYMRNTPSFFPWFPKNRG
jgi:steroid 5-alpha reductase family enzyme